MRDSHHITSGDWQCLCTAEDDLCTYQWYALPPIPGAWRELGGVLMEQASIPGPQSCVWSSYISIPYKYPISPCCAQCVTGRYGNLKNSQRIFQRHVTQKKGIQMQFEWTGTIPTKYQLLGEDSYDRSHTILQHLPLVCQVGHTIDRHIR